MNTSLRQDVSVGHDSCAIALTSQGQAGCALEMEPGSEEWVEAVRAGLFLPIELTGDRGGTCVRILVEEPLSAEEEQEWIDHFAGTLVVDDGQLVVCGSTDFLDEQLFADTDMTQTLQVRPGVYRVDVYSCFVGINGPGYALGQWVAHGGAPLGAWFRRTRPGVSFPLWLRMHCYDEPGADPGCEQDWVHADRRQLDLDDAEHIFWVDFIIRLTRQGPTAIPSLNEDGFVPTTVEPRLLSRCPLGLEARLG